MAVGFDLAGKTFAPGTRGTVRIPVTTDLDGGEVAVTVHVLAGATAGPALLLLGVQHGDEWGEVEFFRRVISATDPAHLAGTLVVIPVASPTALGTLTRLTQWSADGPDMNRLWPGGNNWIAEQIAAKISAVVLPHVNALLDFHFGMWGNYLGLMTYGADFPDPKVNTAVRNLAFAYGFPLLHRVNVVGGYPGPRSVMGYAGIKFGIPGIAAEVGGMGFGREMEEKMHNLNLKGVRNVMRHMGMLPEKPELADKYLDFTMNYRVDPSKGGLLKPVHDPDEPLREVKKGEVLARVLSPYTFEELEQLVSPCDGVLTLAPRTYMVRPGDWAFFVADTTHADSKWVSAPF
jgi:uncharacterized protein